MDYLEEISPPAVLLNCYRIIGNHRQRCKKQVKENRCQDEMAERLLLSHQKDE